MDDNNISLFANVLKSNNSLETVILKGKKIGFVCELKLNFIFR